MEKIKVNSKVASLLVLAGLFAGWQYMLLVTAFVLIFCFKDEDLKKLTIKVLVIMAACSLFGKFWDLIEYGYSLGVEGINGIFGILGAINPAIHTPYWITQYIFEPLEIIIHFLGSGVAFIILLIQFNFILATITGRRMPKAFVIVDDYMTKFSDFVTEKINDSTKKKEKICPECGAKVKDDAKFCTKCGTKFEE